MARARFIGIDILPYGTFCDGNNNHCFRAYHTIVAISLDRLLAVTFPLQTFIHKTLCLSSIFAMWIISIAVEIPTLLASHLDEIEGKTYCIVDLDITFGVGAGEIHIYSVIRDTLRSNCCSELCDYCGNAQKERTREQCWRSERKTPRKK